MLKERSEKIELLCQLELRIHTGYRNNSNYRYNENYGNKAKSIDRKGPNG